MNVTYARNMCIECVVFYFTAIADPTRVGFPAAATAAPLKLCTSVNPSRSTDPNPRRCASNPCPCPSNCVHPSNPIREVLCEEGRSPLAPPSARSVVSRPLGLLARRARARRPFPCPCPGPCLCPYRSLSVSEASYIALQRLCVVGLSVNQYE